MLPEIAEIAVRSVAISGAATLLALSWSLPLAYYVAERGSKAIATVSEALVGVPTTLIGLLLYFILRNDGPLGFLQLLYTPYAIVVGEAILVTPLLVAVTYRVLANAINTYGELALSLGASRSQAMELAFTTSLPSLAAAAVMAFSRAVGEIGVALIVGGNIRGYTRTMTTAIALEVAKGEFWTALELGLILVSLTVVISLAIRLVKGLWEL